MSIHYLYSHINSAAIIISRYTGNVPFASYLKTYFAGEKKFGSKDRKSISTLCFAYFRLGQTLKGVDLKEKIIAGIFVSGQIDETTLLALKPAWEPFLNKDLEAKLACLGIDYYLIFPFLKELSPQIDHRQYCLSFLIQPDVFIRIRPQYHTAVSKKLQEAGVNSNVVTEDALALPQHTPLQQLLEIDKEVVIQDLSSQKVGKVIKEVGIKHNALVWDCCAASGGKSILLKDVLPHVQLTVSDVRQSIIHNLQNRFKKAGINNYAAHIIDVTKTESLQKVMGSKQFDLIIADVPCSGSGTWSRTPEQLFYFEHSEILRYVSLQKKILTNILQYLKPGGHILYVTCSVFALENEGIVEFLTLKGLTCITSEYLKGYDKKADTMFAAVLTL